jgi:hypothetical protein
LDPAASSLTEVLVDLNRLISPSICSVELSGRLIPETFPKWVLLAEKACEEEDFESLLLERLDFSPAHVAEGGIDTTESEG